MDCGNNFYLYRPIEKIGGSIESLNIFCNKFKSGELTLDEKVNTLEKVFHLLNERVPMELKELTWAVQTLDMEKDRKVLYAAFNALNELQIALQTILPSVSKEINFGNTADVIKEIHTLAQSDLADAVICAHAKIGKLENSIDLPTIGELESMGQIAAEDADLLLAKEIHPSFSSSIWGAVTYGFSSLAYAKDNLVFTPGKYYNPIPCSISSYHFKTSKDVPERILDIISMFKGEMMSTSPSGIKGESGDIADRHGEFVMVPSVFAADLVRMKHFKINGVTYYDQQEYIAHKSYNPNECAREIYRLLGKVGGERFMQACQQATMVHVLMNIYPLTAPDGAWGKLFPEKFLNPSDDSGFIVDLLVDHDKNLVIFTRKILMKLHNQQETAFTAHFIAKTEISIPLDELCRSDFMETDNPTPNLHVTDTVSTLVINNHAEAEELLEKF